MPGAGLSRVVRKIAEGVVDFPQPPVGHGKYADLIDRAVTVLDGADYPVTAVAVTLEIQDCINHVLQHPRACQGAFLGHMPHKKNRGAALFGESNQARRAFAHLGYRTGGGLECLGEDCLD